MSLSDKIKNYLNDIYPTKFLLIYNQIYNKLKNNLLFYNKNFDKLDNLSSKIIALNKNYEESFKKIIEEFQSEWHQSIKDDNLKLNHYYRLLTNSLLKVFNSKIKENETIIKFNNNFRSLKSKFILKIQENISLIEAKLKNLSQTTASFIDNTNCYISNKKILKVKETALSKKIKQKKNTDKINSLYDYIDEIIKSNFKIKHKIEKTENNIKSLTNEINVNLINIDELFILFYEEFNDFSFKEILKFITVIYENNNIDISSLDNEVGKINNYTKFEIKKIDNIIGNYNKYFISNNNNLITDNIFNAYNNNIHNEYLIEYANEVKTIVADILGEKTISFKDFVFMLNIYDYIFDKLNIKITNKELVKLGNLINLNNKIKYFWFYLLIYKRNYSYEKNLSTKQKINTVKTILSLLFNSILIRRFYL